MDSVSVIADMRPLFPLPMSDDDIHRKILNVRDKSLLVHSYKCLQNFRFVHSRLQLNPFYPNILTGIQNKVILDIGCCLGVETRRLMVAGARKVIGVELKQEFLDLGFDLFRDRDTRAQNFLTEDLFSEGFVTRMKHHLPDGYADVIFAGSVLHLFDEPKCREILRCFQLLLRPHTGELIGQNLGKDVPGMMGERFLQSPSSMVALLREYGLVGECAYSSAIDRSHYVPPPHILAETNAPLSSPTCEIDGAIRETGAHMMAFYARRE